MSTSAAAPNRKAAEPSASRYATAPRRYLAATRPAFLAVTLVGCLVGLAAAHGSGVAVAPATAVLTIVFALVAHAGANVLNDYYDHLSGADAANLDRLYPFTGGSRFIQNGVLTPHETARFGYLLLALVVPAGLALAWVSGPGLLALGLAGLAIGWAYSAPPLKLMSRGLGELAVATSWLLVVIGSDFVQRGAFAWAPAAAGVSYALLVANLLYINQFPDRGSDGATGKRTLVVRLGLDEAKWVYLAIALVAYGWLVVQVGRDNLPQAAAGAALTLVLSFHAARQLVAHAEKPDELGPAIRLSVAAVLLHGAALAVALAFGRWPAAGL